jgi:heptosyltransferase-2
MSEKVLIRGVNWIGDAVMTLPALSAIRKGMPENELSLLVKPSVSAVYQNSPYIDEILLYGDNYSGILGKLRLSRDIKHKNFSQVLLLQNAFDAAFISYLARIPKRTGYSRDGRGFLLTHPVPYSGEDKRMHHIYYFLELVRRAGIAVDKPDDPWIRLTLQERLWAREALKDLQRPVVGINPGAAYGTAKQWFADRFASVARSVIEELGGSIVVFGNDREAVVADKILKISGHSPGENIFSMAGKTSVRELIALISECDVLVTNDSGPMHLGYAVKTPLVAIFGSTEPTLTGPVGTGNIVLRKKVDCSPCFDRHCSERHIKCMDEITSEEVFKSVSELIPSGRAVFFDRDGTLCEDANYLNSWNDFKVLPEISTVNLLIDNGFMLNGITNQSGVARGIVDEEFMRSVNNVFREKYGFTDFYYCPHHPDDACPCRKPEPGMLLRARVEHGIDLKRSYMVGDNEKDLLSGKAVGAKSVLVQTGTLKASEHADFTARDMKEAVNWILKDSMD